MKEGRKPKYSEETLGVNPLITNLVVPVRLMRKKNQEEIEFDMDKNCKIFIESANRKLVNELSSRSKEMFLWIIYTLETGRDHFWLNRQRYMKEMGIASQTTFKAAIDPLIQKNFICKTTVRGVYFINPSIFYSGSRVNNFPEKVKRVY
ncbi:replication/maintenance protein RepL [Sphingobacterium mizutaii]|uniref:replication/maintenance protein RepL n=1 Tax=Sphingobacterium mizutaii TaxID=1010 RepID=UPI00289C9B21|nr:replication/maintenance protein RepL [Sphingobacterium mizutaii]